MREKKTSDIEEIRKDCAYMSVYNCGTGQAAQRSSAGGHQYMTVIFFPPTYSRYTRALADESPMLRSFQSRSSAKRVSAAQRSDRMSNKLSAHSPPLRTYLLESALSLSPSHKAAYPCALSPKDI